MTGQTDDRSCLEASRPQATGPGLIESMLWVSGYHLAQTVAVAMLLLLLLGVAASAGWAGDPVVLLQISQQFFDANGDWVLIAMTGTATLGSLFFIVPLALWRLRPSPRLALGTGRPSMRHFLLLTGAVLPLGILADELYRASSLVMEQLQLLLVERFPQLAGFDVFSDSVSLIQQQTASTSYPLLLIVVGLGPAIGEEIIFRGLIGRGLIARRGVVSGVLLTSLLFAAAHVSPVHAIATLPIALFLHVSYLATGSIWAPIFVHFLNNGLSVTMMKFGLGQEVEVSAVLLISSAVYVLVIGLMLVGRPIPWERITSAFAPQKPSLAVSSADTAAATCTVRPLWSIVAAAGVLCFTCSFVAAATAGL